MRKGYSTSRHDLTAAEHLKGPRAKAIAARVCRAKVEVCLNPVRGHKDLQNLPKCAQRICTCSWRYDELHKEILSRKARLYYD